MDFNWHWIDWQLTRVACDFRKTLTIRWHVFFTERTRPRASGHGKWPCIPQALGKLFPENEYYLNFLRFFLSFLSLLFVLVIYVNRWYFASCWLQTDLPIQNNVQDIIFHICVFLFSYSRPSFNWNSTQSWLHNSKVSYVQTYNKYTEIVSFLI